MSPEGTYIQEHANGVLLQLRILPRSSRTGPLAVLGEGRSLKWGVHAAAVDGKANTDLIESLAEFFRLPKRAVAIMKGEKSRDKCLLLEGISVEAVKEKLA